MAAKFSSVKENFVRFIQADDKNTIEDWLALNQTLPFYKMPTKKTLKAWERALKRNTNGNRRTRTN